MKILKRIFLSLIGALIGAIASWACLLFFAPSTSIDNAMLVILIGFAIGMSLAAYITA